MKTYLFIKFYAGKYRQKDTANKYWFLRRFLRKFAKMRGRLAILPTLVSMMMVLFTTMVPHHHHQAMICLVKEVCVMDGCCDDEHTGHSDANHEEDESLCVSHQKYFPSDDLRLDFAPLQAPAVKVPVPVDVTLAFHASSKAGLFSPAYPPPILSWRINC